MPRRPQLQPVETKKGWKVDVSASLSKSGKRERFFYATEREAGKHAAALRKIYHERGTKAGAIDPALASAALEAVEMLKPFDISLLDVVRDYVKRNDLSGARATLDEAWTTYEAQLLKKGRSEATLNDYARDKRTFPDWFKKLRVSEITEKLKEKALDEATSTRGPAWNRKFRELRAVINAALSNELKAEEVKRTTPDILSATTAANLMKEAVKNKCALPFALLLFAGIRPHGELGRISWGEIKLKEGHIIITGELSKTNDDRMIPISSNLSAWLKVCAGDDIVPENWQRLYQSIRSKFDITTQDVTRHSFASMFYRIHGEQETIQAMGHQSFKTTEKFYKRAVTEKEARAFFQIAPKGVKVSAPKALKIA